MVHGGGDNSAYFVVLTLTSEIRFYMYFVHPQWERVFRLYLKAVYRDYRIYNGATEKLFSNILYLPALNSGTTSIYPPVVNFCWGRKRGRGNVPGKLYGDRVPRSSSVKHRLRASSGGQGTTTRWAPSLTKGRDQRPKSWDPVASIKSTKAPPWSIG